MKRDDIGVTTPCGRDFEAMRREGKKRFCDDCKKHVHDLSAMAKDEARALLASPATDGLCVRFLYDEQGDVLFADDPRLVAPSALVRAKRFVAAAAALALPMSLNACMGAAPYPRPAPPPPAHVQDEGLAASPDAGAPSAPLAAPEAADAGAAPLAR